MGLGAHAKSGGVSPALSVTALPALLLFGGSLGVLQEGPMGAWVSQLLCGDRLGVLQVGSGGLEAGRLLGFALLAERAFASGY